MAKHNHDPKRTVVPYTGDTHKSQESIYEVAEDQDIPEHLVKRERKWAKTERWRARLDLR